MLKKISAILLSLICFIFVFSSTNIKPVYAENNFPTDDGLVSALMSIAEVSNSTELLPNTFSGYNVLDLSSKNIKSIKNLNYFNFNNVKTLNLSYNNLTSLDVEDLKTFTSLEELNVSYNELTNVNLASFSTYTNLNKLLLNNNYITNINISFMKKTTIDPYCNLQNNLICSLSDITLPGSENPLTLDLNNNLLVNETSFDRTPHTLNVFFQGIGNNSIPSKNSKLKIFKGIGFVDFNAKLYYKDNTEEEIYEIRKENSLDKLYAGEYIIKFFDDDKEIYNKTDISRNESLKAYNFIEFKVYPTKPIVKFYIDDQEVDKIPESTKKQVQIKVETEIGEDAYFSVNGSEFTRSNIITIESAGSYNFRIKSVCGELSSEEVQFSFKVKKSLQILKIILITLGITLLVVIGCFAYFFMIMLSNKKKNNKKS